MSTFLTVKEAAELTRKSTSSIRRIIYPIVEADDHPDRSQIQPSVEEVRELRMKGENFPWRLSEELLRREVPADDHLEKGTGGTPKQDFATGTDALISMLRRELDIKNIQIAQQGQTIEKQMDVITGLSERLREGNVLIGSLQQHLALPETGSRQKANPVDAKSTNGPSPEKGTKKNTKAARPKRGLFGLFR